MTARQTFKEWSRNVKREIKRLEACGEYAQAAWLANAHAKQIVCMYK